MQIVLPRQGTALFFWIQPLLLDRHDLLFLGGEEFVYLFSIGVGEFLDGL